MIYPISARWLRLMPKLKKAISFLTLKLSGKTLATQDMSPTKYSLQVQEAVCYTSQIQILYDSEEADGQTGPRFVMFLKFVARTNNFLLISSHFIYITNLLTIY